MNFIGGILTFLNNNFAEGVVQKTQKKMFHSSSLEKATNDDFATSKKDCQNLTFE